MIACAGIIDTSDRGLKKQAAVLLIENELRLIVNQYRIDFGSWSQTYHMTEKRPYSTNFIEVVLVTFC